MNYHKLSILQLRNHLRHNPADVYDIYLQLVEMVLDLDIGYSRKEARYFMAMWFEKNFEIDVNEYKQISSKTT